MNHEVKVNVEDMTFGYVRCTAASLKERLLSKAKVRSVVRGGEVSNKILSLVHEKNTTCLGYGILFIEWMFY